MGQGPVGSPKPPAVELLTLNGSKPNLSPNGEGITSYRATSLFKLGETRVKPLDPSFKIELPVGYQLFNNLAYLVDSEAIFSGPNEVVFRIPAAATPDVFNKLRILYADYDEAEPEKPRWVDITLASDVSAEDMRRYFTKDDLDKRRPDFQTRTLHALLEESARVFVVALRDSSVARDRFVADLSLSATPTPQSVMEGREITYSFQVTNIGPDTATGISFRSYVDPDFVSLEQSQGVCRWEAHNIYCDLGTLPKGASATVTYRGRCQWNFYYDDKPVKSGGMDATPLVGAAEGDPNYENNQVFASAAVVKDPNKAPVVAILSPTRDQFFVGPAATVNIVANAHDPDGTISKIEFYDQGRPIGSGRMTGKDKYELTYSNLPFGQHLIEAVVEDNQGRPGSSGLTSFFVNGQATVEVVSPSANQVIRGPLEDLVVTVRASHPSLQIKNVEVHHGTHLGGNPQTAAPTNKNGEYVTTFKSDGGAGTHEVYVVVTDDSGVATLTYPIQFRITERPRVDLYHSDGGYARDIPNGAVFASTRPLALGTKVRHFYHQDSTGIVKVEFFANDKLICTDINQERKESSFYNYRDFKCSWSPSPGTYRLLAVATDTDGEVGKSTPVEVVIR